MNLLPREVEAVHEAMTWANAYPRAILRGTDKPSFQVYSYPPKNRLLGYIVFDNLSVPMFEPLTTVD